MANTQKRRDTSNNTSYIFLIHFHWCYLQQMRIGIRRLVVAYRFWLKIIHQVTLIHPVGISTTLPCSKDSERIRQGGQTPSFSPRAFASLAIRDIVACEPEAGGVGVCTAYTTWRIRVFGAEAATPWLTVAGRMERERESEKAREREREREGGGKRARGIAVGTHRRVAKVSRAGSVDIQGYASSRRPADVRTKRVLWMFAKLNKDKMMTSCAHYMHNRMQPRHTEDISFSHSHAVSITSSLLSSKY